MTFIIYAVRCSVTGKTYVGQTRHGLTARWRAHVYWATVLQSDECRFFWRAIRKYGPEAFEIRELDRVGTAAEADVAEIRWIAALNTRSPHGYNIQSGGGGFGADIHPSTRAKFALRNARHWGNMPEDVRKRMAERCSASAKGQWAAMSADERSEATRRRLAALGRERRVEMSRSAMRAMAATGMLSERVRRGRSKMPVERKSEIARTVSQAHWAAMTPAMRTEKMNRAWVTRRALDAAMSMAEVAGHL